MTKDEEIDAAWRTHDSFSPPDQRSRMLRTQLAERQNWRCCYCGERMRDVDECCGRPEPRLATFEHVIPRFLSGTNVEANLVVACSECNGDRGHECRPEHWEALAYMDTSAIDASM
jgi:5-methylcytosine-specific restriction endonuclease McrA